MAIGSTSRGPRLPPLPAPYSLFPRAGLSGRPLPLPCPLLDHIDLVLPEAFTICSCISGRCHLRTRPPTYANLPGGETIPQSWDIFKLYKILPSGHPHNSFFTWATSHLGVAPVAQKIRALPCQPAPRPESRRGFTICLDMISIPTTFWKFHSHRSEWLFPGLSLSSSFL